MTQKNGASTNKENTSIIKHKFKHKDCVCRMNNNKSENDETK